MSDRYSYSDLLEFATALLAATGLPRQRAATMAEVFVEADLLGFTTHGLNRLPSNLEWLEAGTSRQEGDPVVLVDRGSTFNWDADFLPGPWVVSQALEQAMSRVAERGIVAATLRRSQHIASLAAYCPRVVERGYAVLMTCSTPSEYTVTPFGGIQPVFSANPLAFAAPAPEYPLLLDVAMSIGTLGSVTRAAREGKRLPEACLLDNQGNVTDDPEAFFDDPPGGILPIGGMGHGHKGYALCLVTEALSMALGGYGRADAVDGDGEANSVYLQVIDPAAFGPLEDFKRQIGALRELCRRSRPAPGFGEVRVPGQRAWERRRSQIAEGVELYPTILDDLWPWAEKYGVVLPERLG